MLVYLIKPGQKFQNGFKFIRYHIEQKPSRCYYVFIDNHNEKMCIIPFGRSPGFLKKRCTLINLCLFDPLKCFREAWDTMIETGDPVDVTDVSGFPDSIEFRALKRIKTARTPDWETLDHHVLLMYKKENIPS